MTGKTTHKAGAMSEAMEEAAVPRGAVGEGAGRARGEPVRAGSGAGHAPAAAPGEAASGAGRAGARAGHGAAKPAGISFQTGKSCRGGGELCLSHARARHGTAEAVFASSLPQKCFPASNRSPGARDLPGAAAPAQSHKPLFARDTEHLLLMLEFH